MDVCTRLAALIVAALLAIDAFGAGRAETLRVDRHEQVMRWHQGDDYRLHLAGGAVDTCDVGRAAFDALADGDLVVVDASRVFKACNGIRHGAEVIGRAGTRRWVMLLPIAILLAAALGWIRFEQRVEDDRGWWFS